MKSIDLDRVYRFLSLMHQLQKVERTIYVPKTEQMENDVEHQYQLALISWYLNDSLELNLDKNKLVQYALIHDFVEVYAGDVFFYTEKKDEQAKHVREIEAAQRLKKEFPEFGELHSIIETYESRADPEARFIYALDKLLPIWNIHLDNGKTWKRFGITLEMLVRKKKEKVDLHEDVKQWFEETVEQLRRNEENLFPTVDKIKN